MNRFKKEIRRHGWKLESDFEYLPYDGVETVVADAETATISTYHVSAGWCRVSFNRGMEEVMR